MAIGSSAFHIEFSLLPRHCGTTSKLDAEILQDFPQGNVTTKVFPASFCELGVARFQRELNSLPVRIQAEVIESLRVRCQEQGNPYVLPSSLQHVL